MSILHRYYYYLKIAHYIKRFDMYNTLDEIVGIIIKVMVLNLENSDGWNADFVGWEAYEKDKG